MSNQGAYRYRNTRPGSVFLLAATAALIALALVWTGWTAIGSATEAEKLAPPPDLKKTVARIEATAAAGRERIAEAARPAR